MGEGTVNTSDDMFVKYKIHKKSVLKELIEEAMQWKEVNGIQFPEELISGQS